MNTSQRNIVRIGCYVLAALALLAAMDAGFVGLIAAIVLVIIGKVVWAGRPMGHVAALGRDILEVERLAARVDESERRPTPRALPEASESKPRARPPERVASKQEGPEIVRLTKCVQCGAENRGDAYNCAKCGALMRSRRGVAG